MTLALKSFDRDGKRVMFPGVKNEGFDWDAHKRSHVGIITPGKTLISEFYIDTVTKKPVKFSNSYFPMLVVVICEN